MGGIKDIDPRANTVPQVMTVCVLGGRLGWGSGMPVTWENEGGMGPVVPQWFWFYSQGVRLRPARGPA